MEKDTLPRSERPVAAVAVFLRHPGRGALLFIRRSAEPFKGLWGLPGGRLRTGEHPAEAARRELVEETGIEPERLSAGAVVSEVFTVEGEPVYHTMLFLAEATACGVSFRAGAEGALEWLDLADLPARRAEIIPSDYAFIEEIFLKKKRGIFRARVSADGPYRLESFEAEEV